MASVSLSKEPLVRYKHAAVASNHRMLVWGGDGGVKVRIETSAVECFDVLSASWAETRQLSKCLPDGLYGMAIACDEERAYSFGGLTKSGHINDLYEVNLTSLVCRKLGPSAHSAPSPSGRAGSAMLCSRRKLVHYGGYCGGGVSDVFDLDNSKLSIPSLDELVNYDLHSLRYSVL